MTAPGQQRSPLRATGRALPIACGLFVTFACAAGTPLACSATSDSKGFGGDSGSGSGSTTLGNGGAGGIFAGSGGKGTGGGADCVHCSADLHTVLDCDDNVVTECPADQGCAPDGTCVAPCDSAKANASTLGCDFFSVVPGSEHETRGSCFAALLANTWTSPITISVDYAGVLLDASEIARRPLGSGESITYQPLTNGQLEPGQIAVLFLSRYASGDFYSVDCPLGVIPGIQNDPAVDKTGLGNAFHISTDRPVIAYDIYPYGGAVSYISSATLLVPTPAWGTNYIAADAYEVDPNLMFANGYPFIQIVGSEDDTKVTISPSAAILGGPGVAPTGQGQPATYTLNRGQVIQFLQDEELSGSPISSDKPVSVWGGSSCMNIPVGYAACDSAHQQLLPVNTLGHEYLGTRYRDRVPGANESVPYTIVGAVDGTNLTYEPAPPPGAPGTVASGQTVEFSSPTEFVVKSQDEDHPFYFAIHMTGANAIANNFDGEGDPEYVNVVSPAHYLPSYLFLTDPTYRNTHLAFTRVKGKDGTFEDVNLDCLGKVSDWTPIGGGGYEMARVDLVAFGLPVGNCNSGVHTAKSQAAFGLTVWGWDEACSYGYPAGMRVQPINTVIVPPDPK